MNVGVIGTGNMGTILIESFIESRSLQPSELFIYNRTHAKAEAIKKKFRDIYVATDANEIARCCDIIFICVKPLQFHALLHEIKSDLAKNTIIISITSPITVRQIEAIVHCKVARIIPSILNRALAGPSLLSFGERCTEEDKNMLTNLVNNISTPLVIEENITRVSSDIVSCGPAFISYILQQFIEASVRQTEITKEEATKLTTDMMIGLGKLLEKQIYTLPSLQEKVCVVGGITGEGIRVLQSELGDLFDHLFQATHAKYVEDKEKIQEQFASAENVENS